MVQGYEPNPQSQSSRLNILDGGEWPLEFGPV